MNLISLYCENITQMSVTNLIKKDFKFIKLYFFAKHHTNAHNVSHFKDQSFSNVTVLYGSTLTVVNWSLVNRNRLLAIE